MSRAKRLSSVQRVENYGLNPLGFATSAEALAKLTPRQRRRVRQKARGGKLW